MVALNELKEGDLIVLEGETLQVTRVLEDGVFIAGRGTLSAEEILPARLVAAPVTASDIGREIAAALTETDQIGAGVFTNQDERMIELVNRMEETGIIRGREVAMVLDDLEFNSNGIKLTEAALNQKLDQWESEVEAVRLARGRDELGVTVDEPRMPSVTPSVMRVRRVLRAQTQEEFRDSIERQQDDLERRSDDEWDLAFGTTVTRMRTMFDAEPLSDEAAEAEFTARQLETKEAILREQYDEFASQFFGVQVNEAAVVTGASDWLNRNMLAVFETAREDIDSADLRASALFRGTKEAIRDLTRTKRAEARTRDVNRLQMERAEDLLLSAISNPDLSPEQLDFSSNLLGQVAGSRADLQDQAFEEGIPISQLLDNVITETLQEFPQLSGIELTPGQGLANIAALVREQETPGEEQQELERQGRQGILQRRVQDRREELERRAESDLFSEEQRAEFRRQANLLELRGNQAVSLIQQEDPEDVFQTVIEENLPQDEAFREGEEFDLPEDIRAIKQRLTTVPEFEREGIRFGQEPGLPSDDLILDTFRRRLQRVGEERKGVEEDSRGTIREQAARETENELRKLREEAKVRVSGAGAVGLGRRAVDTVRRGARRATRFLGR